ncbi:chorismate synthase [Floccifex sp.]|uniref:chorismate synthase n=1 Tax=Floccifex sp. TaxID=2815810 RepID=UPI003F0CA850
MKNSFGNQISMTIFGESHGPCIGITLDGLPAGFKIDEQRIAQDMDKRKAKGKISTQRHEEDKVEIVSGYFEGYTTGTSLALIIQNKNTRSNDYKSTQYRLRPGHADYTAYEKYKGYQDYRGGGHFSGRLTACIVAAGSICRQILESKGVFIGSHLKQVYTIEDDSFDVNHLYEQIQLVNKMDFAVLNETKKEEMNQCIEQIAANKDSVGGILETAIVGIPAGIGEPFFDSVESILSHLLFSIPAVKGVSFGLGFGFANLLGSQANDAFVYTDHIETKTNNNAGINGGITNGMPILINTCIKPTPSIFKTQQSVDYQTKENVELTIQGRHDPCIIHRARVVVDSIVAFGLLDLWMSQNAQEGWTK